MGLMSKPQPQRFTPLDETDLEPISVGQFARHVMMPQARCNIAINVSGNFSQRMRIRRKALFAFLGLIFRRP